MESRQLMTDTAGNFHVASKCSYIFRHHLRDIISERVDESYSIGWIDTEQWMRVTALDEEIQNSG
jgi:hypothetical protein